MFFFETTIFKRSSRKVSWKNPAQAGRVACLNISHTTLSDVWYMNNQDLSDVWCMNNEDLSDVWCMNNQVLSDVWCMNNEDLSDVWVYE